MQLKGQYLAIWISDDVARQFLQPRPEVDSTGDWVAYGKVVGETPGIGIWLLFDALYRPDGGMITFSMKEPRFIYLVRWEWMRGARVFRKMKRAPGPKDFGFVKSAG